MRRCPAFTHARHGFTLTELLISLVIFAIILGGMYNILYFSLRSWNMGDERMEMSQNARIAMARMTDEMRQMKGLDTPGQNKIVFWLDANDDWVSSVGEMYSYVVSGSQLMRVIDEGMASEYSAPIADFVQKLAYAYRDESVLRLNEPVDRTLVRTIEVTLVIGRGIESVTMTGFCYPRILFSKETL